MTRKQKRYFKAWADFARSWEGCLSDHPDDPGGLTNAGVTFATFRAIATEVGVPPTLEVFYTLCDDHKVHDKFLKWHWDKVRGDEWKDPKFAVFFAEEFWMGGGKAINWQRIKLELGGGNAYTVKDNLIDYLNTKEGQRRFAEMLVWKRDRWTNPVFMKGWNNRADGFEDMIDGLEGKTMNLRSTFYFVKSWWDDIRDNNRKTVLWTTGVMLLLVLGAVGYLSFKHRKALMTT